MFQPKLFNYIHLERVIGEIYSELVVYWPGVDDVSALEIATLLYPEWDFVQTLENDPYAI